MEVFDFDGLERLEARERLVPVAEGIGADCRDGEGSDLCAGGLAATVRACQS